MCRSVTLCVRQSKDGKAFAGVGGEYYMNEPDYGNMTPDEVNFLICMILAHQKEIESKIYVLLICSEMQILALIILLLKSFLL